ncbi:Abi family protein [Winogradskyella sp. SYSU M77433]|uniref:Abi family protein n=1 Tax=Winogradskyella sp. SYSU M77433 TaxID=3042722 RepID=UPI0024810D82|nr:Abi family protein [Winogradskyella sp. SYSU M77433]MDH7912328.1 Abi family protein [Winogradskyella sp. SYSU M77433]
MGNKATTVEQQINRLVKRGLVLNNNEDIEKAKEILSDIGYYRLGFYWYYYQDKDTHEFNENVALDDIVKLYYFDFDLKMKLLRYIYRIEVHFRTQLVYEASNHYIDNNTWYVEPKIINKLDYDEFYQIYEKVKSNSKTLSKHHANNPDQDYAPAWKVFEFLTFGQVFNFYNNLKNQELKKKIAGIYGFRDIKLLNNYLSALINIRNICSHNGVLFDYEQPYGIMRIPNMKYRNKTYNNTNLNASIRLLLFMLSKVSKNRANELEQELKDLFTAAKENNLVHDVINTKIKFDL